MFSEQIGILSWSSRQRAILCIVNIRCRNDAGTPPPLGGVSYLAYSLNKNPEEEEPPQRTWYKFFEGGPLPWLGNLPNMRPPGGGVSCDQFSGRPKIHPVYSPKKMMAYFVNTSASTTPSPAKDYVWGKKRDKNIEVYMQMLKMFSEKSSVSTSQSSVLCGKQKREYKIYSVINRHPILNLTYKHTYICLLQVCVVVRMYVLKESSKYIQLWIGIQYVQLKYIHTYSRTWIHTHIWHTYIGETRSCT